MQITIASLKFFVQRDSTDGVANIHISGSVQSLSSCFATGLDRIFHELELTGDILCPCARTLCRKVAGLDVGRMFVEGFVSCGAELSVGEEDLLTREVPSLKNSSYKGPKRRSNSCCDGNSGMYLLRKKHLCSSGSGQGVII
ncbi:hypothetical protein Tco_1056489 [Tanacetum coccineum]|uniref:Uncharacterized protein n=1 Tax=Tanacetum coccineum TaxID=301880 RepID=A0ABQ5H4L8_9ASTR